MSHTFKGLMSNERMWIGGFDGPQEGIWAWTGAIFTWSYTNWNTGYIIISTFKETYNLVKKQLVILKKSNNEIV
jgi:hypothetical protein